MKKKIAIIILGLTVVFSIVACGSKESLTEPTETNSIVEDSETIETEVVATESIETTEVQESETEVSDVMHEEWEWIDNEAYKFAGCESNHEFVEKYAPGTCPSDAWREYALQNGADSTDGVWWIYYNGHAAGEEKSYAINQLTGEKIEAGPIVMLRENDYIFFWGAGDEYWANFDDYLINYMEDYPYPVAE